MTVNPTAEQLAAVAMFETGRSLTIEAGAGTGKTSTLRMLAASAPHRRGQYLAFNKAIVDESKQKFPGTVRCNTAHSAAFRAMIRANVVNMERLNGNRMKPWDLAARLGINSPIWFTTQEGARKQLSATFLAGLTMKAITRFCQSADPHPNARNVPYVKGIDAPGLYENNSRLSMDMVGYLHRAWADLTNHEGSLPFSHDVYLKAWQLNSPRIAVDYILFDEAQDANPVMVDIVAQQAHRTQVVWVGDSQQQIYTFTGAVNAMKTVGSEQTTFLTQSFRFGPEIAAVANAILGQIPDAQLRLKGTESIESTTGPISAPDAILTRTNAEAVRHVLQAQAEGKRAHLVGGGTEIVSFAKGAQAIMDGRSTEHPDLACFDSWGEVLDYVAHDEQGADLRLLVTLITEFTVPTILAALDNMVHESAADVVVSTAHKSKGREWNTVQLGADFPDEPEGDDESLRLLYVAATRAKFRLDHGGVPFIARALAAPGSSHPDPMQRRADDIAASDAIEDAAIEADHEHPEHDHAACEACNAAAREHEHEAEGNGDRIAAALSPTVEDTGIMVYVGRSEGYRMDNADMAIAHAHEVYRRTGKRVMVTQGAELIVELDA